MEPPAASSWADVSTVSSEVLSRGFELRRKSVGEGQVRGAGRGEEREEGDWK